MPTGHEAWVHFQTRIPKILREKLKRHVTLADTTVMDYVTAAIEDALVRVRRRQAKVPGGSVMAHYLVTCVRCRWKLLPVERLGDTELASLSDHLRAAHPNMPQPSGTAAILREFDVASQRDTSVD